MQGLHLTADLHQCRCAPQRLTDGPLLVQHCLQAVRAAGLQPVAQLSHAFAATAQAAGGVTATILLAESHVCVHTWPEHRAVTLDVYVCNFAANHSAQAQTLMAALVQHFDPQDTVQHALQRGAAPS